MLAAFQLVVLLQVFGVNAGGELAALKLRDVLFPRSPVPSLVGDVVKIFSDKRDIAARQDGEACGVALTAISACESFSPGFLTFAASSQAPCLCYSSDTWIPDFFDDVISTCISEASSADPTGYSAIAELSGFCTSVGNVRAASASASATASSIRLTATPTPSATSRSAAASSASATSPTITSRPTSTNSLGVNPGCATVSQLLNSCASATRGFTDSAIESQAACLCYSSSTWLPDNFDDGVATCADYVSTAVPDDYSVISALGGFCTVVGDVLAETTGNIPTTRTTRGPLTGGGLSGVTNSGNTNTAPATPGTTSPPKGNGPVTVTAAPSPTSTPSSGVEANRWNGMFVGIVAVAVSAVLFL